MLHFCRPLTQEELELRREAARLRFKQKMLEKQEKQEDRATSDGQVPLSVAMDAPGDANIEEEKKDLHFIAFARVFSGTLKVGQKVYVLHPKYDPSSIYNTEEEVSVMQGTTGATNLAGTKR